MNKISKPILVSLVLLMVLIGSAGATQFYVDVVDGVTGNYIPGASVYFITTNYGGSTTTSNMYGRATFNSAYTVVGDHYVAQASKSGYTTGTSEAYSMLQAVYDGDSIIVFIFPVTPSPTPTPSSLSELGIIIRNYADTAGISGASATLSGPGVTTSTKTTLSDGTQEWTGTFTVGQTYRLEIAASGYTTQYWNVVITQTMLNIGYIYECMNSESITVTPTPTPTPTVTPTATPTWDGNTYSNFIPAMTSNTEPSGNNVAYSSQTYYVWKGFDHSFADTNGFMTDGASGWAAIHLSSGHVAKKYNLTSLRYDAYPHDFADRSPGSWTLYGSNDGSSWTSLDSRSGITWSDTGPLTKSYTLSNTDSYSDYKIQMTSVDSAAMVGFGELEIFETYVATPTPTPTPTPTSNPSQDGSPYYHVDVIDGITGNYISGATVHFQTTHYTRTLGATYSAGRATFTSANTIIGDTYLAEAEKTGYNSGPLNYYTTSMHQDTITSDIYNSGTPLMVYLYPVEPSPTPMPSSLSELVIQILGEDTVTGLSGAAVTLSGPGVTTTTKITLSDGTQEWTGNFQRDETYRITVSSLGFNTQYWDVVLTQTILNNGVIYEYMDIQSILASCVINVNIVSASTAYLIQGANFGIYDPIHNVWNNATTNNGLGYFDATGGDNEYPLSIGENVTIAAWADGYQYNSQQITISDQESEFWLNLLPTGELPSGGNFTIVFTALSNVNQHPIKDVTITSGLGAIKLTNDAGTATFIDIPIGTNRNFQFTKTGYQSSTLTVNGGDGEVIMKIVELVPIGVTATPTQTFVVNPGISNQSQDLNVKGQTFLIQWADMAIGTGSLVFLLLILYFARKLLE